MPYFVYILQADDGTYYIGQTRNLDDRLRRHQSGRSLSTKSRSDWKHIYTEEYPTRSEAIQRERQIKARKSRQFVEQLVRTSRA